MRTSVIIYKDWPESGWVLRVAANVGTDQEFVKKYKVRRLITALEMANTLQIHVDNVSKLPLTQYKLEV